MFLSSINFYYRSLGVDQQIFLYARAFTVVAKLPPSIIAFCTREKDFNNEVRILHHVTLSTVLLIATYRGIRIYIAHLGKTHPSV
jgi:hypothetical protein